MNVNQIEAAIHNHMSKTSYHWNSISYNEKYGYIVRQYFPVALGESISIQASKQHYCSPKKILSKDEKYETVEVYARDTLIGHLCGYDDVISISVRELAEEIYKALEKRNDL